jgi:DNA-binding MarR family transcriptional regulator
MAGQGVSRLLQLDPGTLSPLLERLEPGGLVDRPRDPRYERALAVALTDAGRVRRPRSGNRAAPIG